MPGGVDEELVETYVEAAEGNDDPQFAANSVLELCTERVNDAENPLQGLKEMRSAGVALRRVAEDRSDADAVIEYWSMYESEFAQKTQKSKADVREPLTAPVRKLREEERKAKLEDDLANIATEGSTYSLETGVAVDEYLETLDAVIRSDNQDAVSDPEYIFKFADGTQFSIPDGNHLVRTVLYRAIESASDRQVRNEIASLQAADDIDALSIEEFIERYRMLSNGPPERPWGLSILLGDDEYPEDSWNESITHLINERLVVSEDHPGPRSSAWKRIRKNIERNPAAMDKQSVATVGKGSYYDEEFNEFWVPNSVVMDACDEHSIEPNQLAYELHERGVVSDELPGKKASMPDASVRPQTRFWRFDATAEEVKEPTEYVDSLTGTDDDAFGSRTGREHFGGEA